MEITIFKEITTEDALVQLEAVAEKYTDLYCDMENKDERKFVKDKAAFITGIRKKIDRARIDKTREYKSQVESEFEAIDYRLAEANKPFTLLIDEHKENRAKILAEKKAIEDKKAMIIKIQDDHETAIMMNKIADIEKEEKEKIRLEHEEKLKAEAVEQATLKAEKEAKLKIEAELQAAATRKANTEHITKIKTAIKLSFINQAGLCEQDAINATKALFNGKIAHSTVAI